MAKSVVLALPVILTICIATLWQPLLQRATVLGLSRSQAKFQNVHGKESLIRIPNTIHCEDLHYHAASHKFYTACEGDARTRTRWFPPLGHMDKDALQGQGRLVVVDPTTFKATELVLSGFSGPFVTHGIDIFSSEDGQTLTIFAVNHLPNPDFGKAQSSDSSNKARSQVEVFSHTVGSDTAVWIRSVRHARIRTPNDIFATSETSFYVTNDHYYREGAMRSIEDLFEYNTGAWSDVVHVDFTTDSTDASSGVTVTTGVAKAHNPNGLGHSNKHDEVLLGDASGGELLIMGRDLGVGASKELTLRSRIQLDSGIDNPSYYEDKFATPGNNASGYVLAGLPFALALAHAATTIDEPIPSIVWHVQVDDQGTPKKTAIFQDVGKSLRSASAAVLIGIDPKLTDGEKMAWLFVTGFVSDAIVAVKVGL